MMEPTPATARAPNTRTIGAIYGLYFLAAFACAYLLKGLTVPGNPAATSAAIVAHEGLYRAGVAVELLSNAIYIAVTALFYRLFAPVDKSVSLVAAFLSLAGCVVQIVGGIFQLAPLVLLGGNPWLGVFAADQLQAAALLSLKLYAETFNISLVLFALYDLLLGVLVFRSKFLPRTLGVMLALAGLGWSTFAWPPLATAVSAFVLPFGALAELILMAWLLVRAPRA